MTRRDIIEAIEDVVAYPGGRHGSILSAEQMTSFVEPRVAAT